MRNAKPFFDAARVRRYYDRHTGTFLRVGQEGSAGTMHRAVWGPGVATRAQAFHYVEDGIAEILKALPPAFGASHVIDLGCGVGASLCYLAERLPIRGTGLTLSPVQGRLAEERASERGCAGRIRVLVADYAAAPNGVAPADLAFAIESFVHAPSPERFLAQCHRIIRRGGLLLVCDDFARGQGGREYERTLQRFRRGWHVNTLISAEDLRALAHAAGFAHRRTTDLTPYLELGRPRDRLVDALAALLGPFPLYDSRLGYLLGGSALQKALSRGWIGYDLALFERL